MELVIGSFRFLHGGLLLLLLIIPILVFWYMRNRKTLYPSLRMSTLQPIQGMVTWRGRLRGLLPLFRVLSLILFIIALARPQQILKEEDIKAEGIDIFLVMDLSNSMLAQDFKPNRLEVSKDVALEFVDKRAYDRIGLSVFSGEAFTQCPLTTDHRVVKEFLRNLSVNMLSEQGTAIGMGLASAINRLKNSESKSKVAILLTDGVNNAGYIMPETATEIAKEFGVKVYTIGVGTNGRTLAPISQKGNGEYIYNYVRVEIDEALLQQIARETGGQYFRATTSESLAQIYEQIDQLEKTEIEVTTIKRYSEEFPRFLIWGLLFLLLEMTLRYTVLRTVT